MDPRPPPWLRKSGWVRYPVLKAPDGQGAALGDGVAVEYPHEDDGALVFDVETMVQESHFSVMATAAGPSAWYAWLSPWLLGESDRKDHLIPFGPASKQKTQPPRLLIGHNVGYDRARIADEYHLEQSQIRFLDTLSLHVAVRGISSPQRPAWIQYRKNRAQKQAERLLRDQELRDDQREELRKLLGGEEVDEVELEHLNAMGLDLEALAESSGASNLSIVDEALGSDGDDAHPRQQIQWQDISSTNSLAEVASLYCGITLPKELRNFFADGTSREGILERLDDLMGYCAQDVAVTHSVFSKVLPAFREACPHPATFAGVLGLGSPILPVDDEWKEYQKRCNVQYEEALSGVRSALVDLAEALREEHKVRSPTDPEWFRNDPWLRQMDWSPKKPKKMKVEGGEEVDTAGMVPKWYREYAMGNREPSTAQKATSHLLMLSHDGRPLTHHDGQWQMGSEHISGKPSSRQFLTSKNGKEVSSDAGTEGEDVLDAIRTKAPKATIAASLRLLADTTLERYKIDATTATRLSDLDWTLVAPPDPASDSPEAADVETWPKWYWELYKPMTGTLEVTIRTKVAPLLLKVSWRQCPLFHSREHGWIYMHDLRAQPDFPTRQKPLTFHHEADEVLAQAANSIDDPVVFYKVPHTAGEDANVGSPFSKSFMSFFDDGTLRSEHPEELGKRAARDALDLNAQCSYWIGVRDRVANQMVVWDGEGQVGMGFPPGASGMRTGEKEVSRRKGLILPQVITMGTITRRAIEKTWLTASNAKKNRVGSELKSLVKAPPGWVIVGADVDSEELWICSVMGDAQFGIHGATAIGWMTLEGTKSAGTDLHSKTASILGTSRNQAKIFNYSRIYGAGIRHATQLLLKANPGMAKEEATRLAKELYASTKGNNTHTPEYFGRKFWYGGTESFVFNKLEDVALGESPRTPALDCGITAALSRKFLPKVQNGMRNGSHGHSNGSAANLGGDFMPSRINWVVQSSGVDYLHLLITSMDHLCRTYDIEARFMLSVHDEVRYLAKEGDGYRAALALQVANLWTRAMFAFKLEMEGLPEGVAWFAQVDLDKVLRKEVDDPCVTPSQPEGVPSGEALDILQILEKTSGGSLHRDGRPMAPSSGQDQAPSTEYPPYSPSEQRHRSDGEQGILFLQAQASDDVQEIRALQRRSRNRGVRMGAIDDVERPGQGDLAEIGARSSKLGKPSAQSRHSQRSPGRNGLGVSATAASRSKSQPSGTASYSTQANEEAPSLSDLMAHVPRRRYTPPPPPLHRQIDRKRDLKWRLYRGLLRECPEEAQLLTKMIRRHFRQQRHLVRFDQAAKQVKRAEALLADFRGANGGNKRCANKVAREVAALEERRRIAKSLSERHAAVRAAQPPPPRPRPSGSLLKPTFFNPPLPRFKPVQPVHISAMIRHRILAKGNRFKRRVSLNEMQQMLGSEMTMMDRLGVSLGGESSSVDSPRRPSPTMERHEWTEHIKHQLAAMRESDKREEQRSKMKFTEEQLMQAKEVRRLRLKWLTEKKAERRRAAAGLAGGKQQREAVTAPQVAEVDPVHAQGLDETAAALAAAVHRREPEGQATQKRGRPCKQTTKSESSSEQPPTQPRKRGRPRKAAAASLS